MNDLDLRDLRLIAAIDQHGGVTKASSALNLTQSALSHQLADLERRLGAPAYRRVGRRLVITPAGERLLEAARTILPAVATAAAEVKASPSSATRRCVFRRSATPRITGCRPSSASISAGIRASSCASSPMSRGAPSRPSSVVSWTSRSSATPCATDGLRACHFSATN
jgi:DNA-binding transcriptional ArsR family regulator